MFHRYLVDYIQSIRGQYKVLTITGPRQAGKTTLCRYLEPNLPYANLEDPEVRRFATEGPKAFLSQYPEGAILDEVQRTPELPSYVQVSKRYNLLFFRDSNGNEVDLIQPLAIGSLPIEIKLATTFNGALLKGLKSFQIIEDCPEGKMLVYNGTSRVQKEVRIFNFFDFVKTL